MGFGNRVLPLDPGVLCSWWSVLWKAGVRLLQRALFSYRDRGLHFACFGRLCASWMDRAREHPVRCGPVQRHRSLVAYSKEVILKVA